MDPPGSVLVERKLLSTERVTVPFSPTLETLRTQIFSPAKGLGKQTKMLAAQQPFCRLSPSLWAPSEPLREAQGEADPFSRSKEGGTSPRLVCKLFHKCNFLTMQKLRIFPPGQRVCSPPLSPPPSGLIPTLCSKPKAFPRKEERHQPF